MRITREQLKGHSFNSILEMIAETACGVWCPDGEGGLILIDLADGDKFYGYGARSDQYSEIDFRGVQKIGTLIHTNSETGKVEKPFSSSSGNVISVENPLVARGDGFAGTVAKRLSGYTYQAWHCEKALLDSHVIGRRLICSTINFEGMQPLVVGNFTLDVDSTGIYFSGGRDPQSEERWGYQNKIERQKIGVGKWVGNSVTNSNGMKIFRNENLDDYPDDF